MSQFLAVYVILFVIVGHVLLIQMLYKKLRMMMRVKSQAKFLQGKAAAGSGRSTDPNAAAAETIVRNLMSNFNFEDIDDEEN